MAELKPTYGNFVARGIVTGLTKENAFTEGQKEGGNPWKKVQFGLKVSETQFVYVELMGSKTESVRYVFRNPETKKLVNDEYYTVLWKDRYKKDKVKENYELSMGVTVGLERDEECKKKDNQVLTAYDAVDYIKKYLKDGDSVYVRGQLQITEYNGKPQEKYVIQKIYLTSKPVDFKAEDFDVEASFNQEIVFLNNFEDIKGRTLINTNIIYKKDGVTTFVPYTFVIDPEKYKNDEKKYASIKKLVESFKKLEYGSTIRVYGNINHGAILQQEEIDDDFGGFTPKGQEQYIRNTVKELEITGADGKTLIRGLYTEEDFYVNNDNPFAESNNNEKHIDIDDDDLPF